MSVLRPMGLQHDSEAVAIGGLSLHGPIEPWVPRYARFAFVLVAVGAFAGGFVITRGTEARVLTIFTFASSLSVWCGLDARVHGKLFLRSFAWLMLFTWPVGLLAHLVWTRR